ncbi:hypothetical protein [Streptomyces microflavus]|uniref:hypothetical protein n=1 Tax=Streptomyces microflavus TaxID=1919 RepID=UPI003669120C
MTLSDGALLVGVSRSAVSNWQNRHRNFPQLALLTGSRHKRTKWVVAAELVEFARGQLAKKARPASRSKSPARPAAEIAAEQIAHSEEALRVLTERERRLVAALARTRAAKRQAVQKGTRARARLDAEVDAIARLGIPAARQETTIETKEQA